MLSRDSIFCFVVLHAIFFSLFAIPVGNSDFNVCYHAFSSSQMVGCWFTGMCMTGAWCCLDEFNRIDVEVLSVISQQLQTIKFAKQSLEERQAAAVVK